MIIQKFNAMGKKSNKSWLEKEMSFSCQTFKTTKKFNQ